MLTPVPMERVRIVSLREDLQTVISTLHEAGAMQLEQVERGSVQGFGEPTPPELQRRVADESFRFEGLVASLPGVAVSQETRFNGIEDVLKEADGLNMDEEVKKLKVEVEAIDLKLAKNRAHLQVLDRIGGFTKDLSVLTSSSLSSGFFLVPEENYARLHADIVATASEPIEQRYGVSDGDELILYAVPRSSETLVKPLYEKYKALKADLPYDLGTPQEAKKRIEAENTSLEESRREAVEGLLELSRSEYGKVLAIREALAIETQRHEAVGKLLQSDKAVIMEGWVPRPRVKALEEGLEGAVSGRAVTVRLHGGKDPPTLLENDKRIRTFEFLVRFFSLPKEDEIDPTSTFSLVFPIFFGLMVGDVGYGAVILLLGLYFARIGAGKTSARALPKAIRSFGRGMMSKGTLGTIGKLMMAGGASTIVFGVLFNEYFGASLPWYGAVIEVVGQLPLLLVITIFIGLGHITLGYIFGIYLGVKTGHIRHALGKIGWLGFMWSGTAGLVDFFDRGLFPSPLTAAYVSVGALVASAVVVGLCEGPRFAMEIPTLMSHVMSYARILGVLLASVLLAFIVDTSLGASVGHAPLTGVAFVLVIAVLVHLLNIVLGIFEPSIQGVRLHYVEFYTKFFEGNGRPFVPFAVRKKYTK